MRRICQQSRRWHQQFSPFTNEFGHRQCLQRLWLPGHYQHRQYARGRESDVVVHEYDQAGSSKKSRVAVNPKEELEETGKYLRSKIERLEKELAEMRKGPFSPDGEFMRSLSPDDRKVALETLQKEGSLSQDDLDDTDMTELDRLIEDQDLEGDDADGEPAPQVILEHPSEHVGYIRHFNATLKDLVDSPTRTKKEALWVSYQNCRFKIPNFLRSVTAPVWDILWDSQTSLPDNARFVRRLAQDKLFLSLPLSSEQLLVYMECLRLVGEIPEAITFWNKNRSIVGPDAQFAKRFWSLGVRLYSESDQPKEAQEIAMQCLNHGSFADATILVPVIESWSRRGSKTDLDKAWACYLRFKAELGTAIKMEDYQSLSTSLLNRGYTSMALAVYKDMVLDRNEENNKEYGSISAFVNLVGHVGKLQASAISEQEVSKVSLAALTVLPRFLQNKYFYASWIKRLIGLGEVDSASKVVELMYERGIRPDARHVNGIIGAWLREGSKASRIKAEQMGWAMVNTRIEFVRHRQMGFRGKSLVDSPEGLIVAKPLPEFIARPVPPATIETFSVLLLHYTRRCKDDLAEQLMDVMTNQAMIAPNAYIWNHWLYAALRVHDLESVGTQYSIMKTRVTPDLQTFACLWDTAKVQWDASKSAHSSRIPTARKLFREMNDWMTQLPRAPLIRARQEFSRDLYNQIIRVFCVSNDLPGTLCALHGLQQLFGQYPDEVTTRLIVLQIARFPPPDTHSAPSGPRLVRRWVWKLRTAISSVNDILQIVSDQRAVAVMDAGLDPQDLDEAAAKQFQLDVLSDLLVFIINRLAPFNSHVDNEVKSAAEAMDISVESVDFGKQELLDSE